MHVGCMCEQHASVLFQTTPPSHLRIHTKNSWQGKDLNSVTLISFYYITHASHCPCEIVDRSSSAITERENQYVTKKGYLVCGESALQAPVKLCI